VLLAMCIATNTYTQAGHVHMPEKPIHTASHVYSIGHRLVRYSVGRFGLPIMYQGNIFSFISSLKIAQNEG